MLSEQTVAGERTQELVCCLRAWDTCIFLLPTPTLCSLG